MVGIEAIDRTGGHGEMAMHAAGDEAPPGVDLAVIEALVGQADFRLADSAAFAAFEIKQMEARIHGQHRAAAFAQGKRAEIAARQLPMIHGAGLRVEAMDCRGW